MNALSLFRWQLINGVSLFVPHFLCTNFGLIASNHNVKKWRTEN